MRAALTTTHSESASARRSQIVRELRAMRAIASVDHQRMIPAPYLGPYQNHGGVCFAPVWDFEYRMYRWMIFDQRDYWLVLARRWRLDPAGYPSAWRYDAETRRSIVISLHRLITNAPAGVLVDHIQGDRLDVRRSSLRFSNHEQNAANRRLIALAGRKSSPFRGVTFHRATSRWQSGLKHRDRFHYLGLYDSPVEAALVYDERALEIWGEFAVRNFPFPTARAS